MVTGWFTCGSGRQPACWPNGRPTTLFVSNSPGCPMRPPRSFLLDGMAPLSCGTRGRWLVFRVQFIIHLWNCSELNLLNIYHFYRLPFFLIVSWMTIWVWDRNYCTTTTYDCRYYMFISKVGDVDETQLQCSMVVIFTKSKVYKDIYQFMNSSKYSKFIRSSKATLPQLGSE